MVTQPIRVRLQGQPVQTGGKTIIQTVQMPSRNTQHQVQQQQQQQPAPQRNRNATYAQIKQSAIVGNAENTERRGRVIANRNAQPKAKPYQPPSQAQAQYDSNTHDIKTDYYGSGGPSSGSVSSSSGNTPTPTAGKKRQRETREDEGGPGFVKAKGTWYRARKCHKCDKTFPWASSLRRHLMTHTGLKPYCCAACKAQFTTKSNLERHVLRRHGVLDKEGQAKYIIKLSQAELQRQLEEENEGSKCPFDQYLYHTNQKLIPISTTNCLATTINAGVKCRAMPLLMYVQNRSNKWQLI